jgi:mannitol-1-phosphate/altronate dehydrogenase
MGECGIGLLPADQKMAEALIGLYTVVERGAEGDKGRIIGSLKEYWFAPANPAQVLDALTAEATRLVTLTITGLEEVPRNYGSGPALLQARKGSANSASFNSLCTPRLECVSVKA